MSATATRESCGTYAGYQAHKHRSEKACRPCTEALRRYQHAWRVRTGRTTNVHVPVALLRRLAERATISDPAAARAARALLGEELIDADVTRDHEEDER